MTQIKLLSPEFWANMKYVQVSYFFHYKTEFFLPKQSQTLDPSYKMDLDLWDCLRKIKLMEFYPS